jgi:hypothetical protein
MTEDKISISDADIANAVARALVDECSVTVVVEINSKHAEEAENGRAD